MKHFFCTTALCATFFVVTSAFAANTVVIPLGGIKGALGRTGQTSCYNEAGAIYISCSGTGQDGEYRKGISITPRFTDNENGTVTDNLTRLIWLKKGDCTYFFSGDFNLKNARTWTKALTAANSLSNNYCGLHDGSAAGDWRLPNIKELLSLIDYQNDRPTLPTGHPFTGVYDNSFWSSTTSMYNKTQAWRVSFEFGDVNQYTNKSSEYSVIAVRGGQ